jgi:4-diphosphocytidyl-2-C-methyl-D-erythritol kinase
VSDTGIVRELAPFKINLALYVTGKRADGYHLLETLFAFADFGDMLSWEPADQLSLAVTGPFAGVAPANDSNLVWRAAEALMKVSPDARNLGGRLCLDKRVPAGAGLGGGSADAAAALRLLNRVWGLGYSLDDLSHLAASLGADVPVCLLSRPAWGRGVGDLLTFLPSGKALPILVIYPGKPVSTPALFSVYKPLYSKTDQHDLLSSPALSDLSGYRNDLEEAACKIEPLVAEVLAYLRRISQGNPNVLATGMSGSGSACFALCRTDSAVQHLETFLRPRYGAAWLHGGKLLSPFI